MTFGRRVYNRAAPKRTGTCLSPPPVLFLSVCVPHEPGRREGGGCEESGDERSKGENRWVCEKQGGR